MNSEVPYTSLGGDTLPLAANYALLTQLTFDSRKCVCCIRWGLFCISNMTAAHG